MASRCDEQEAADDLRKLEAVTSESADVLIAVVKDLQTKSLWISVAVAGTNPYRFMLILVRSCFRLPLLLLDLLVRVLLQGVFHTFHTCMLCPHIYIYIYILHAWQEKLWHITVAEQTHNSGTDQVEPLSHPCPQMLLLRRLQAGETLFMVQDVRWVVAPGKHVNGVWHFLICVCLVCSSSTAEDVNERVLEFYLVHSFLDVCVFGCSSNTIARCQWSSCPCSIVIQPF